MLPWKAHAGNIFRISIINIFESPKGFCGTFNCLQHCKQDLPKKVDVAAHAIISKKPVD
jgi:hypothetical protein